MRTIFDYQNNSLDYRKRRATDVKCNAKVNFPRNSRNREVEASLEMVRIQARNTFLQYRL